MQANLLLLSLILIWHLPLTHLFVYLAAPNILPFGNAQINLALLSLIRIFANNSIMP